MPKLIVNPGTEQSWEIPLPPGATTIGSDPALPYAIAHESVSPAHCEINVSDGVVRVRDLGSASGTFINHAPITESALKPGQSFHVGGVELALAAEDSASDPPIPRRISVAVSNVGAAPIQGGGCCKYHPKAVATWHCGKCQANFCDLCVSARNSGGAVGHFCRKCGSDCEPVAVHYEEPVPENFYQLLPDVFKYPFRGGGAVMLAAGAVFLGIVEVMLNVSRFVPIYGLVVGLGVGVFATGYLFNYAKQIVVTSAQGGNLPPDWPETSEWVEEIVQPWAQLMALVLLTFGPAIVFHWWHPLGDDYAEWLQIAAMIAGALFAPMAMLLLAMFDSIAALNPIPIVRSILRIPLPYLVAAGVFEFVIVAYYALAILAHLSHLPTLLAGLVMGFLELYAISAGMRVLGLLYRTHKEELGWFDKP